MIVRARSGDHFLVLRVVGELEAPFGGDLLGLRVRDPAGHDCGVSAGLQGFPIPRELGVRLVDLGAGGFDRRLLGRVDRLRTVEGIERGLDLPGLNAEASQLSMAGAMSSSRTYTDRGFSI